MSKQSNLHEQIEYGLASIDPNRTVEVSLQDLMRAYQTIGLLINFFHQPLHYVTLDDVRDFIDVDSDAGALELLKDLYYRRFYGIWPQDVKDGFEEGHFDNPSRPYYYERPSSQPDA